MRAVVVDVIVPSAVQPTVTRVAVRFILPQSMHRLLWKPVCNVSEVCIALAHSIWLANTDATLNPAADNFEKTNLIT